MSPWWLRPTAEGAEESDEAPEQPTEPAEGKPEPAPEDRREKAETGDRSGRSRSRRGGENGGGRSRSRTREGKAEKEARSEKPRAEKESRPEKKERRPEKKEARPEKKEGRAEREGKEDRSGRESRRDSGRRESGREETKKDEQKFQRNAFTFDDVSHHEIAQIREEVLSTPAELSPAPERTSTVSDEKNIAMFCDLENIALGVRDSPIKKFDINLVMERLLEKGKIIVKKAYCDWERYSEYKRAFHEVAIELIDIPQKYYSGKNSADIKMVVDAMDLSYSKEHLDTFVIVSGDSDFSPLVSKLKENNKGVIGVGVKDSSSNLLIANCDEFIFYEDLWRTREKAPQVASKDSKKNEAFSLMVDAIQALLRENKDILWGSMIKQTMQRKKPSFNESYYGYSTFSDLLEDAERNELVKLKKDQRSGTYIVTGFANR